MIWRPKPGQRVRLHYRRGDPRMVAKLHGTTGTVRRAGAGPGPINAEVLLDPPAWGICVVVPRGNLAAVGPAPAPESPCSGDDAEAEPSTVPDNPQSRKGDR